VIRVGIDRYLTEIPQLQERTMRTRRTRVIALAGTVVAVLASGVAATASAASDRQGGLRAAAGGRDVALILDYRVARTCAVHPNYPKEGVLGNDIGWTIDTTDIVAWRYNVNETWAMISDKKYRGTGHPWWGFTHRDCIGTSIGGEHFPTPTSSYPAGRPAPSRILEGRSGVESDHYRTVDFRLPAAHVIDNHKRIDTMGTLRDAPNRFVIGNVFPGWHVQQTDQRDAGWTKVYVPNAKRWGWVQDIHF
jgi:hypothetical protein